MSIDNPLEDFFEDRTEDSDVCPDCGEKPCICLGEDDEEFFL